MYRFFLCSSVFLFYFYFVAGILPGVFIAAYARGPWEFRVLWFVRAVQAGAVAGRQRAGFDPPLPLRKTRKLQKQITKNSHPFYLFLNFLNLNLIFFNFDFFFFSKCVLYSPDASHCLPAPGGAPIATDGSGLRMLVVALSTPLCSRRSFAICLTSVDKNAKKRKNAND